MHYDAAGNLDIDTYSAAAVTRLYDAENRMTKETQANSYEAGVYSYDGDGHRVKRKVGSVETWQVYGLGGELVAEYAQNGSYTSPQKEYGYRNGQLLVTVTCGSGWGDPPTLHDNPLVVGETTVQARHITELRTAINALRAREGMAAYSWTTSSTTSDYINANAIIEMRTALDQALGTPPSGYAAGLAQNQPIKAVHIQELRDRLTAAWSIDIRWLVSDQLGTPRMAFDQSGSLSGVSLHDYLPFGEELYAGTGGRTTTQGYSVGDGARQKFTLKERDNETGLDYFGARYYASAQGRLTSPDDFLNDTHVTSPASWNLYAYVRNNPLRYVDPLGQEVYSTNLTAKESQELIDDWKKKTGYKNIYFDKNNQLVIDTKAGFAGGSAKARDQLSDAVNSTSIRFNLKAVDTTKVAFADVNGGTTVVNNQTKATRTDYTVSIDFGDFRRADGDDSAKEAYSVGLVAIHEFDHRTYNASDDPNSATDPTSISQYETGKREPPLLVLLRYAKLAGVSKEVLIDDKLDLSR